VRQELRAAGLARGDGQLQKKLNQCSLRPDSRLWRTTRMRGGAFSARSERAGARQTDFELIGRGGALLDVWPPMYVQYDLRPTRLTVHPHLPTPGGVRPKPRPPQSYKAHLEGGGKSGLYFIDNWDIEASILSQETRDQPGKRRLRMRMHDPPELPRGCPGEAQARGTEAYSFGTSESRRVKRDAKDAPQTQPPRLDLPL
jgi:hypothetical protein